MYMSPFPGAKDNTEGNNEGHHKFNKLKTSGNRAVKNITQTDISGCKQHHGCQYPDGKMLEYENKVSVKGIKYI